MSQKKQQLAMARIFGIFPYTREGAKIGKNVTIGQNVYIDKDVVIEIIVKFKTMFQFIKV